MKMPFLKLKLPGEQTELTKKRSSVQTIMHVHYPARQIRNFDVCNNNNTEHRRFTFFLKRTQHVCLRL